MLKNKMDENRLLEEHINNYAPSFKVTAGKIGGTKKKYRKKKMTKNEKAEPSNGSYQKEKECFTSLSATIARTRPTFFRGL